MHSFIPSQGSVCHKLAACLTTSGYKTGLYTSPHISSIRERIQIDGELISKQSVQVNSIIFTFVRLNFESLVLASPSENIRNY